jgi:hypothetical protein
LCWAIALIENPYAPNMDAVKGKMMLRYERRLREAIIETEDGTEAEIVAEDAGDGTEVEIV